MGVIEQDALNDTTWTPPPIDAHDHVDTVKSVVMTPRAEDGPLKRLLSWWKSELKPGIHIVQKDSDPLRTMFLITSNSYEDRDNETITTEALKAYEESCYPAEDMFYCDNPLLWWHDDDVVMGEIVAVNLSGPFLIEVARELPNPVSKVLWDYAEQNGDNAGTSHRFGYLEKDRDDNGVFRRIFKQETSYLPERHLAANDRTYAGVIGTMATPASDKRLDDIFKQVAGIENASAKLHAKTGELEKELAALGIQHKALPPKPAAGAAEVVEGAADVAEEVVEEDAKSPADMGAYMATLNQIFTLVMELVDAQTEGMGREVALAKALDEAKTQIKSLEETMASERAAVKTRTQTVDQRLEILEKRLALAPRRAADQTPVDPKVIAAVVTEAEKSRAEGEMVDDPIFGKLKPPIKYE